MTDQRKLLAEIYGFGFPDSFFAFQDFVAKVTPELLLDVVEISLAGPFLIKDRNHPNPLWESRYYNDPPEFFTILDGRMDGLHWGYYIDDPAHLSLPVASFYSNDAFQLTIDGDDIFEAARDHLEGHYETCLEYMDDDPDEVAYQEDLEKLDLLRERLQEYATKDRDETGSDYRETYSAGEHRRIVAKTRDDLGIVVPKALYKPIAKRDKFQKYNYEPTVEEVAELAERARQALAAGFPGAALKLGKDIWIYPEFASISYELMDAAYQALGRELLRRQLHIARDYREYCDTENKKRMSS